MFYYFWYLLGYDDEDKKDDIQTDYKVVIIKDNKEMFKHEFCKEFAYRDVIDELKKYLKPIEYISNDII
jgi:hypothetical protein